MQISVTTDIKKAQKNLSLIQKRYIPKAEVKALNWLAGDIWEANKKATRQVFSNPTPFIQKSILYTKAKMNDRSIELFWRDKAYPIMKAQIDGGDRRLKRHEQRLGRPYVISKDAKLNKFGNLTRATYNKILADLQAYRYSDAAQNTKLKSQRYSPRSGGGKGKGVKFIQKKVNGRLMVFEKYGGKRNPRIRPVLVNIWSLPNYKKRHPFYKLTRSLVKRKFPRQFDRALRAVMTGK